jgi:hypothetical protein
MHEGGLERPQSREVHRSAGEVALLTANRDAAKAEVYLERGIVPRAANQPGNSAPP